MYRNEQEIKRTTYPRYETQLCQETIWEKKPYKQLCVSYSSHWRKSTWFKTLTCRSRKSDQYTTVMNKKSYMNLNCAKKRYEQSFLRCLRTESSGLTWISKRSPFRVLTNIFIFYFTGERKDFSSRKPARFCFDESPSVTNFRAEKLRRSRYVCEWQRERRSKRLNLYATRAFTTLPPSHGLYSLPPIIISLIIQYDFDTC